VIARPVCGGRPLRNLQVSAAKLGMRRGHAGLLLLLALLLISSGLGLRDPWPADEPRYALVAKQMVESGDWLFPHRGQELYPDKPPLFMWVIAVCLWLTGSLRVAFLLPSLLAGLLSLAGIRPGRETLVESHRLLCGTSAYHHISVYAAG
jgi:hypothetical protein